MKRSSLIPDQVYYVRDKDLYGVTPDGVGVYWYDTRAEVFDQHGEMTVHCIDTLEDFN